MATKTGEFWDGFADMLQGNKELCRRLHQQAVAEGGVMAKTCRTCGARAWYCEVTGTGLRDAVPGEPDCPNWSKRKSLLVDELGEALDAILSALTGAWFSYTRLPGRIEDAEIEARKLINRAERAVTRYQKEVGDA